MSDMNVGSVSGVYSAISTSTPVVSDSAASAAQTPAANTADVAAVDIRNVRLDENGRYIETINSGLNNCLTLEANTDQTGRGFIQDAVMSMFDEGVVALVPVDTSLDPKSTNAYDILTMRTGKIKEWMPKHVRIEIYNENIGRRQEIVLPKKMVGSKENGRNCRESILLHYERAKFYSSEITP